MSTMSPFPGRMGVLRQAIARIEATADHSRASGHNPGGIVEILPARPGDATAACGYALTLAIAAAGVEGTILWIGEDFVWRERGAPYGPGLRAHGIDPARLALVRASGPREALWALEEGLKSTACAAVVGEIWDAARHCDLMATRRLTLAARAGSALGLLIYSAPVAEALSTAARERFEVATTQGRAISSAGRRRPIPEAPAWRLRVLKSRPAVGVAAPSDSEKIIVWSAFGDGIPISEGRSSAALSFPRHLKRA